MGWWNFLLNTTVVNLLKMRPINADFKRYWDLADLAVFYSCCVKVPNEVSWTRKNRSIHDQSRVNFSVLTPLPLCPSEAAGYTDHHHTTNPGIVQTYHKPPIQSRCHRFRILKNLWLVFKPSLVMVGCWVAYIVASLWMIIPHRYIAGSTEHRWLSQLSEKK